MPSPQRAIKAKARAKKVRREAWRRTRNQSVRRSARTVVAKARAAIDSGSPQEMKESLDGALVRLDKAAGKGVIHKRNAARRKSRLVAAYNAKLAAQVEAKPARRRRTAKTTA